MQQYQYRWEDIYWNPFFYEMKWIKNAKFAFKRLKALKPQECFWIIYYLATNTKKWMLIISQI